MKYIIVNHEECHIAILFDEILPHQKAAGDHKVISAGYCDAAGNCWGKSVGLGKRSHPEDEKIVRDAIARRC